MPDTISKSLFTFIVETIDSIELLEVLMILSSAPEKKWSPEELDLKIRSSVSSMRNRLEYLCKLGVATKDAHDPASYSYSPQNDDLKALCEELIILYQTKRTLITEVVYTKSLREIVSFSEAFRIRKGRKDG